MKTSLLLSLGCGRGIKGESLLNTDFPFNIFLNLQSEGEIEKDMTKDH